MRSLQHTYTISAILLTLVLSTGWLATATFLRAVDDVPVLPTSHSYGPVRIETSADSTQFTKLSCGDKDCDGQFMLTTIQNIPHGQGTSYTDFHQVNLTAITPDGQMAAFRHGSEVYVDVPFNTTLDVAWAGHANDVYTFSSCQKPYEVQVADRYWCVVHDNETKAEGLEPAKWKFRVLTDQLNTIPLPPTLIFTMKLNI